MIDARTFLEAERRRLLKIFAIVFLITCVCFGIGCGVLLFFTASSALVFLIVCAISVISGLVGTLALIQRAPLWLAVLPVSIGSLCATIGVGLWLPEISLLALGMFLALLWICSLTNNRSLMLSFAGVGGLLLIAAFGVPLPIEQTFSLGASRLFATVLMAAGIMIACTVLVDRFIAIQNAALALAEQRSAEAEVARAEAASAHAEIERLQAAEQLRLIALVETLELPIIAVGTGMLVVPLVGDLDRRRIISIQQRLLDEVTRQRAHTVVLDMTGVSLLDTHVAQQVVVLTQAVRLLGAGLLMSGIRPEMAHTLVDLEIDFAGMRPVANLGAALRLSVAG